MLGIALMVGWGLMVASQKQPWPVKIDRHGSCCAQLSFVDSRNETKLMANAKALQMCLLAQESLLAETHQGSAVTIISLAAKGAGDHQIQNIERFAPFHISNVGAFAEHRGYHFKPYTTLPSEFVSAESDFRWHKIKLLSTALDTWAANTTFIVWIDSDAIVLDFNFDIETFVSRYPAADLLASADIKLGLINTGFMIMRNTLWMRNFLKQWWQVSDRSKVCDQDAFDTLYKSLLRTREQETAVKVAILPMSTINTHPPAWKHLNEDNRVLHLMGESANYRGFVFQEAFRHVCNARSGGLLSPQLGLSRDYLIQTAQKVYFQETQKSFHAANFSSATLNALEDLSKAAHHYTDILAHKARTPSSATLVGVQSKSIMNEEERNAQYSQEILRIREAIFTLLQQKIQSEKEAISTMLPSNSPQQNQQRNEKLQILVSLIKKAAEAGNALFWAATNLPDRKDIAQQVNALLQDLSSRVVAAHRGSPLHMQALMSQNMGLVHYEEAVALQVSPSDQHSDQARRKYAKEMLFRDAAYHFRTSVRLFDDYVEHLVQIQRPVAANSQSDVSSVISTPLIISALEPAVRREFLQSLQLQAGVLCLLHEFVGGIKVWDRALQLAEALQVQGLTQGPDYEKLALIAYNAAVCYAEYGSRQLQQRERKDGAAETDLQFLREARRLTWRSQEILQNVLRHHQGQSRSFEEIRSDKKSPVSAVGHDEISDVQAFADLVQSLDTQVAANLQRWTNKPIGAASVGENKPTERIANDQKASAENTVGQRDRQKTSFAQDGSSNAGDLGGGFRRMLAVAQADGSTKFIPDNGVSPSSTSRAEKSAQSTIVEGEEDEWEECTELDDDCETFYVDDVSDDDSETSTSQPSLTMPNSDDIPTAITIDSNKMENSASLEGIEDEASLYEGLDPEEILELRAARNRHRRQFLSEAQRSQALLREHSMYLEKTASLPTEAGDSTKERRLEERILALENQLRLLQQDHQAQLNALREKLNFIGKQLLEL